MAHSESAGIGEAIAVQIVPLPADLDAGFRGRREPIPEVHGAHGLSGP